MPIQYSQNKLSPNRREKYRRNYQKFLLQSESDPWRRWKTFELAIAGGTEWQVKCWSNFEKFRMDVCGHKTYTHMRTWIDALNTGENSQCLKGIGGRDTLILAPRGSAKSSLLAEWTAYQIGLHASPWNKIALKILYLCYEVTTASQKSRQIQQIMLTKKYQDLFPWVRPSKQKWGEREWCIDLEWAELPSTEEQYTLATAGINGAINSRRAHLVLEDDLIKSPEDIQSENVRERMISNWNTVIRFTRFFGSRAICLGTRMAPNDIYCTTFVEPKWQLIEQSALLTDKEGNEYSYWEPDGDGEPGQPLSMLQQEREEDYVTFMYQRQNKVVKAVTQIIDPLSIVRGTPPSQFDSLVLGVDLSAGLSQANDFTAMVLGGRILVENHYEFWIIDAWEDRVMSNISKLDAIINIWDRWKHLLPQSVLFNPGNGEWENTPATNLEIFFDSSAYGLSLKGDFQDYCIEQKGITNFTIHAVPASGRGNKVQRMRKHTGLFSNQLVRFNRFGKSMSDGRNPMGRLIAQLCDPMGSNKDDLFDACELCLSGLRSHKPLSFLNPSIFVNPAFPLQQNLLN